MQLRLFLILFIVSVFANAQTLSLQDALENKTLVLVTDFDNTLTGRAWNTLWYLQKIPSLQSYYQSAALLPYGGFDSFPQEVSVTEQEFTELLRNKIAVSEVNGQKTVRSSVPLELPILPGVAGRETPLLIVPGIYTITPQTFRNFKPQTENILLRDNSIGRSMETDSLSRFGPTFSLFQALSQDLPGAENIHVVTARAQSTKDFAELFRVWKNEGLIQQATASVYPVGTGEAVLYGDGITKRKVQLVRDQILAHYRLKAMQEDRKYTVVIGENDPETVREYFEMLMEVMSVKEYKKYLNVILFHAGTETEVARSGLPARYTTFKNGFAEVAKLKQISTVSPAKKCSVLFGGAK